MISFSLLGDDIEVPPEDSEDHFVYHKSNGLVYESPKYVSNDITSYETAVEFCAKKNGTLAIPDSLKKARAIRNLITKHVQLYNYQQPNYLLGKKYFQICKRLSLIQICHCRIKKKEYGMAVFQ